MSPQSATSPYAELLRETYKLAIEFFDGLERRPVGRPVDWSQLLERMGGALPEKGDNSPQAIRRFSEAAAPGIVASAGPRYFGFVTGGAHPATVAAEWLTAVWDQNAFNYVLSPAAAVAEEVVRTWLIELFGLPSSMSLGFTTGATMASFTGLAAARHALLRAAGWDAESQGLFGAPPITVITSEESHATIFAALQLLGLGRDRVVNIPADEQGRMKADELGRVLARVSGPLLVCAQAGNVNSGAFDPLPEIASAVHAAEGWLHVDAAFGMWAAASPKHRALASGIEQAHSITLDCHKWLNVPYDSGLVFVGDAAAHRAAMTLEAPYYGTSPAIARDNYNWVPERSRRARGFAVYAALRALGRRGIAEIVERCCTLARRMASQLAQAPGVHILNDVVLNQVLVRFSPANGGDADAFTTEVIRRVQNDGTCWAGGTTWHGMHALRISVSNWSTTERDIDMSAAAILDCAKSAGE